MFKNLQKDSFFYKFLVIGLPIITLIVGALAYPAYLYTLKWRSQYLLNQSKTLHDDGQAVPAFRKALSAYYLNPEDPEIILNLARKGSRVNHKDNVDWWLEVIDHPNRTGEDLLEFLKLTTFKKEYSLAFRYFARFQKELPKTQESWEIQFDLYFHHKQNFEAMQLAESLLNEGFDDWYLHEIFLSTLEKQGSPDTISKIQSHLKSLAERKDEVGVKALQILIQSTTLEIEEIKQYIAKLRSHPEFSKLDLLLAYSVEFRHSISSYDTVREAILAEFDTENIEDLRLLTTWLQNQELNHESISLIDEELAQQDRQLFLNLLSSKIETGQVSEAFELTLNPVDENPLNSAENLIARARSMLAEGDQKQYADNMKLAVEVVDIPDYRVVELELIAKKNGNF